MRILQPLRQCSPGPSSTPLPKTLLSPSAGRILRQNADRPMRRRSRSNATGTARPLFRLARNVRPSSSLPMSKA